MRVKDTGHKGKGVEERQKKFEGVWEDGVLVTEKWWNREGVETSSDQLPGG